MKLAIISHTEHYLDTTGSAVGWGPTVREINHLAPHFEKIYHVACLHEGAPPPSSLRYTGENIEFVPIPPSGGNTLWEKLSVILTMPEVIRQVSRIIRQVDYFQVRLPTGIGNYLLLWLKIYRPKAKFWIKYAGNWAQNNPPPGYAFQKWFLRKNFLKCKVTVNGRWPGQPLHVLSFENPCLTEQERIEGEETLQAKSYDGNLDFVFVGRLEEEKGVGRILAAFREFKNESRIGTLRLIGDGPSRSMYEKIAKEHTINVKFYGFLNREELNGLFALSHVLLLPSSASEGFPKVIAEGANYGCIPVVSDISSLPQYIQYGINGFVMPSLDVDGLKYCIDNLISMNGDDLKQMAGKAHEMGNKFTYDYYNTRIARDILGLAE